MRLTIWGQLLIIALLLSCFIVTGASPAVGQGDILKWNRVNTPQDGASGDWVIASGTEVNRIAVGCDSKTIYAVDTTVAVGTPLLKSPNGGTLWSALTSILPPTTPTFIGPATLVAVAPDNPNVVAIVDSGETVWPLPVPSTVADRVFFSTNGGATWADLLAPGVAGETITDIAISPARAEALLCRDIVVCTSTGGATGDIYIIGQTATWTGLSASLPWGAPTYDYFSVACEPNWLGGRSVVAIASDAANTYFQVIRTTIPVALLVPPGNLVMTVAGATVPFELSIISASLALPSDFDSTTPLAIQAYVGFDSVGAPVDNPDVYRVDLSQTRKLQLGAAIGIKSISFIGTRAGGNLFAGESATTQIWYSANPQTALPTWSFSYKPPTGVGSTVVQMAPDFDTSKIVYAGTTGAESAFSRSTDSGLSWNQTGLIDTVISTINDIEVSARGEALFITTVNIGPAKADSLWRSTSSPLGKIWERVLARSSAGTGDNPLVRIDPDYAKTKVVWYVNTDPSMAFQELLRSEDGGNSYSRGFPNIVLVDLAVEDGETVYGVDAAGLVSKGANGGRIWAEPVNTYLGNGYSIACARTTTTPDNYKGNVLVGGKGTGNYDVAYSTDGGTTFTPIEKLLPTRDNTLVVASSGYRSDGNILAINSGGMYCWGIFSGGDEWETWWGGPTWPSSVTGLQISRNYGFYFSTPATPYIRWSEATAGLDSNISLGTQPTKALALCGGMEVNEPVMVWVIDQRPYNPPKGGVWCYIDTLSWLGPRPTAPISRAVVNYDPVSGRAGQITITWGSRSLSTGYEIQIAMDEEFAAVVVDIGGGWAGPFYYPLAPESPALVIPAGGGAVVDGKGNIWTVRALSSGKTYYWRVKVQDVATGDAIKSPWSWAESFTVELGLPVRAPYAGPILLSPINGADKVLPQPAFCWSAMPGATEYEFILSRDAAMIDVVIKATVPTSAYACENKLALGKTYFWRVRATKPVASGWSAIGIFTVAKEL